MNENSEKGNEPSSENEKSSEEKHTQPQGDEKLKQVVRQLFQDKQDLKKLLEKEINDHKADVERITEEKKSIQEEYKKLAETFANATQLSSPEQEEKINQLQQQVSDLTAQLRVSKIELNDANLNQQVLQKQVEQYKITVTSLEDDLTKADADKYQLAVTKTQVSKLEDEIRQKTRQIKELETSARWNNHELQKLKGQLAQAGARSQVFVMEQGETISCAPKASLLPSIVRKTFLETEGKEPLNDDEITQFVNDIPSRIRSLTDERESLTYQLQQVKHKYSKIKGKTAVQSSSLPPEKLEETIKFLLAKNEKKKETIETLKGIAERQRAAIKKLQEELRIYKK